MSSSGSRGRSAYLLVLVLIVALAPFVVLVLPHKHNLERPFGGGFGAGGALDSNQHNKYVQTGIVPNLQGRVAQARAQFLTWRANRIAQKQTRFGAYVDGEVLNLREQTGGYAQTTTTEAFDAGKYGVSEEFGVKANAGQQADSSTAYKATVDETPAADEPEEADAAALPDETVAADEPEEADAAVPEEADAADEPEEVDAAAVQDETVAADEPDAEDATAVQDETVAADEPEEADAAVPEEAEAADEPDAEDAAVPDETVAADEPEEADAAVPEEADAADEPEEVDAAVPEETVAADEPEEADATAVPDETAAADEPDADISSAAENTNANEGSADGPSSTASETQSTPPTPPNRSIPLILREPRTCSPPLKRRIGRDSRVPSNAALDVDEVEFAWVYKNGDSKVAHYSHMVTVEHLPEEAAPAKYIAAWQAAKVIAGLPDQHIRVATSVDLVHWSESRRVNLKQNHAPGLKRPAAVWAPVLYLAKGMAASSSATGERMPLMLFYAESSACRRQSGLPPDSANPDAPPPMAFAPGGDIKLVRSVDGVEWSEPILLQAQTADGRLPKVIANKPIQMRAGGAFVLPMWREHPGPGATCLDNAPGIDKKTAVPSKFGLVPRYPGTKRVQKMFAANTFSATLLSHNAENWEISGDIYYNNDNPPKTHPLLERGGLLLEGTIVELSNGKLMQFFRSTVGYIFMSTSTDSGRSWSMPMPTTLPNPNSKIHALVVKLGVFAPNDGAYGDAIVMAYNHHIKLEDELGGVRTNLFIAVSINDGATWSDVAYLEVSKEPKYKYHYPTMLELKDECALAVFYTVGNKEFSSKGGVKVAFVDLKKWVSRANAIPLGEMNTRDERRTSYLSFLSQDDGSSTPPVKSVASKAKSTSRRSGGGSAQSKAPPADKADANALDRTYKVQMAQMKKGVDQFRVRNGFKRDQKIPYTSRRGQAIPDILERIS